MEDNYTTCGSHNSMCGGGSNFSQLCLVLYHKALVGTQKIIVHHGTIGLEKALILFHQGIMPKIIQFHDEQVLKRFNHLKI